MGELKRLGHSLKEMSDITGGLVPVLLKDNDVLLVLHLVNLSIKEQCGIYRDNKHTMFVRQKACDSIEQLIGIRDAIEFSQGALIQFADTSDD